MCEGWRVVRYKGERCKRWRDRWRGVWGGVRGGVRV